MRDDNAFLTVGNVDYYAAKNAVRVNSIVARNRDNGKVENTPYSLPLSKYRSLDEHDLVVQNLFKAVGGEK